MRVVVIGEGVNELTAAHYLARAGHAVTVFAEQPCDDADSGWVPPRIVSDLGLGGHGVIVDHPDPWITAPLPDGGNLELYRDMGRSVDALRRISPQDAAKWPDFCARMAQLAAWLETLYNDAPPDPLARDAAGLTRLAQTAWGTRRLGRRGMADLFRLLPMAVADWLDDWFDSDTLKGVLGAAAVAHAHQGPRSGGTAFRLVHQHVGSAAGVFRPPHSNIRSVLATLPGIDVRRDAKVERITVRQGRATGVALAGGEEITAPLVVSGADPRHTLLDLLEPGALDPELSRAVGHIRARGVAARLDLALERAPGFSTLVIAPTLDALERAYDDVKYRRASRQSWVEARYGGMDADGRHRVAVHVQYVPYALAAGVWDAPRKEALTADTLELLARHAPALASSIAERNMLVPSDLEQRYAHPEGQPHHAELALDQAFWMRPLPELAGYRAPVHGLYLCGPAMHPGAGIACASGAHAARAALKDLKAGKI